MGGFSLIKQLLRQVGFYSKSFLFFLLIAILGFGYLAFRPLQAISVPQESLELESETYDAEVTMTESGQFFIGSSRLEAETVTGESTYRFRVQILNRPKESIPALKVALRLPKPLAESTLAHRFISNGGADLAESTVIDPQTLAFSAVNIGPSAQLTMEIEVPKNYISTNGLFALQQKLLALPPIVWTSFSVALPALTGLLLLLVALGRMRRLPRRNAVEVNDPPSRLAPALLGILLKGRLTSREIAATLIDLARRGHLVIHHVSNNDFRFSRRPSPDKLADFEAALLDQIFGPTSDRTSSEEISFTLAQELFSRQVSQAFILAYRKIYDLGYFYMNPLTLHRRYQVAGILLFILGLIGFFTNLIVFSHLQYFLLFWLAMMVSALMVNYFSKGLPVRTVFGDRELARWLAFGETLSAEGPIEFSYQTQEKYLAYLPYAIVMEVEVEWTRRFYDLPFAKPSWYIVGRVTTVDEFANKLFPLFGYLSHTLALSAQPASR